MASLVSRQLTARFALLLAIAGCGESGGVKPVEPVTPPPSGVTLRVMTSDAGLATALGWQGGAVPEAEVTFWLSTTPDDGDVSLITPATGLVRAQTDGKGDAKLGAQSAGDYRARARRILAASERAALANTQWRNVVGVAAVGLARVGTDGSVAMADPETPQPVAGAPLLAEPMRQGGLVLSQWFMGIPRAFNGQYLGGKYFTIYNNGDTAVYLDALVVGISSDLTYIDSRFRPCAQTAAIRDDPQGVWSRNAARFPGAGRSYPLPPGRGILVAIDAIDHRGATQDPLFDLRGADFEYFGPTDVDNPAVPNMIPLLISTDQTGRGMNASPFSVVFMWSPQDWTSLPKTPDIFDGVLYTRLPRSGRIDVGAFRTYEDEFPYCQPLISSVFDRQIARVDLKSGRPTVSVFRRTALTLPDGRVVLQNTGTSSQDFYTAAPDPWAPPLIRK